MRRVTWMLGLIMIVGPAVYGAGLPEPDFKDFPGYMRALQTSSDPRAKVILQEIRQGPADLAREVAAARREGIPLDVSSLNQPLPPAAENAAPVYQKLSDLLKAQPLNLPSYAEPLSAAYSYTPTQIARVRAILEKRQDVMRLVHQAASRPESVVFLDWNHDSDKAIGELLPYSVTLRQTERLLRTEEYLLARQARYDEAIRDVGLGFRVARHAASPPLLINYMVAQSLDFIAAAGAKEILLMAGRNTVVARQVQKLLVSRRPIISFREVLQGETSFGAAGWTKSRGEGLKALQEIMDPTAIADPSEKGAGISSQKLSPSAQRFAHDLMDAAEAFWIHGSRRLFEVADQPSIVRRPVVETLSREEPDNPIHTMGTIEFSLQGSAAASADREQAQVEIIRALAAVLEFRARYGVLPARLPGAFTDPYTGKPLYFRLEGKDGFLIYSRGANKKIPAAMAEANNPDPRLFIRYPPPSPKPALEDVSRRRLTGYGRFGIVGVENNGAGQLLPVSVTR